MVYNGGGLIFLLIAPADHLLAQTTAVGDATERALPLHG
jgi:hypothetical protein